jgi:hypothetical protein
MSICDFVKDAVTVPKEMRALEKSDYSLRKDYAALFRFGLIEPGTTVVYDIQSGQKTPVNHYVFTKKGCFLSVLLEKIGYA